MAEKAILMIVPGRDDRTFYKAYIMKIFNSNPGVQVKDLDSNQYKQIKDKVLKSIFPLPDNSILVKKTASLGIHYDEGIVYIFIIPSESGVTDKASQILGYISGVGYATIVDTVVVTEDAEDMTIDNRLDSLYKSISNNVLIGRELGRGRYFRCYSLNNPSGMKLLFVVQGMDEVNLTGKHAIEDFIIYLFRNELQRDPLKSCITSLNLSRMSHTHKKLALLIAISRCCKNIEELFFRSLTRDHMEFLRRNHDGLYKIIEIIQESLNSLESG